MSGETERAREIVRRAVDGELGDVGRDLVALLQEGAARGTRAETTAARERTRAESLEASLWALCYVLGDIMDGKPVSDVVDDLPHEARRRVIAARHASGGAWSMIPPSDQFGRLPTPPPRASVMRERVRTINAEDYE